MKTICIIVIALLLSSLGCGGDEATEATSDQSHETVILAKVDSIGVEIGSQEEIFGAIEGAVTGGDGNIAVLDRAACCIKVFSPDGEFLRQISREGNGPGELISNAFLTITENGTLVLTGDGGEILGIHAFDYQSGEWTASEPSFGSPPTCLEGAAGNTYMRKNITFDTSTGEPLIIVTITLNEIGSDDELMTFLEESVPFAPEDMASMVSLVWFGYDLACDNQGRYYVAPRSSEAAQVHAYDAGGDIRFTLELDLEPVLRTEEELETERLVLAAKATAMGDDIPNMEPDPYKPLIRGLEVDGEGNLWVLLGGPSQPIFQVYSPQGEYLYNAEIQGDQPDGASWRFSFTGGRILAWAEEPHEGFQKLWILEVI